MNEILHHPHFQQIEAFWRSLDLEMVTSHDHWLDPRFKSLPTEVLISDQREHIGSWKEVNQLHRELSVVLQKFIIDQENPPAALRNIKPLRAARLDVKDVEGEPGWYSIALEVQPHLTYMGSSFTLSAIGHLDRE